MNLSDLDGEEDDRKGDSQSGSHSDDHSCGVVERGDGARHKGKAECDHCL